MTKRSYDETIDDSVECIEGAETDASYSYGDASDTDQVLFGAHQALPVQRVDEQRIKELYEAKSGFQNVDEYLGVVRHEAAMSNDFEYVAGRTETTKGSRVKGFEPVSEPSMTTMEQQEEELVQDGVDGSIEDKEALLEWQESIILQYDQLKLKYTAMLEDDHRYRSIASTSTTPITHEPLKIPQTIQEWKSLIVNNGPKLQLIAKLGLSDKFKLISLFQRWCSKKLNKNFIKWIFIIVCVIPDVITYDEMAQLRAFAKKLARLLQMKVVEDDNTRVCYEWCVTVVVERYGQKDLAF